MDAIERAVDWERYEDELAASRSAALADAVVADAGQRRRRVVRALATACGVVAVVWVIDAVLTSVVRWARPRGGGSSRSA